MPVEVAQSVETNGLTMRLESLAVTPSMTVARLCMQRPEAEGDWFPRVEGDMNGETVAARGVELDPVPPVDAADPCFAATLPLPYTQAAAELTIRVPHFFAHMEMTQERVDEFVRLAAERGVEVSATWRPESFSYNIVGGPDGVDIGALVMQAYNAAFIETIPGPWSVTVAVPAANP
jgi:hypothetical protein